MIESCIKGLDGQVCARLVGDANAVAHEAHTIILGNLRIDGRYEIVIYIEPRNRTDAE